MQISAITRSGVIGVDAYTREGLFVTRHAVDVAFEDGGFLRVPAGFAFDGASIPARARSLIQSLSTAASVAFLLHDYAYAQGAVWITPSGMSPTPDQPSRRVTCIAVEKRKSPAVSGP